MHPQIIQDNAGTCPICGMDLVELQQDSTEVDSGERKVLYYRHPHNPSITADQPMKDEMGMDYVPVYDDGGGAAVKINPAVVHNMGVRTAVAERGRLWRRIDTVGYVGLDENKVSHVHLRTEGWIDKLRVKSEGERVRKGDVLFEVYSRALVTAQEEYLQALAAGGQSLTQASRERLISLGVSDDQIRTLEKTRRVEQLVKVYARQDGIVSTLNVREGMYITPANEVMTLADLSTVWILVEVFERQADWVRVGQVADVRLSYLPGREWEGRVEYVYPSLEPKTRTLRVRLLFDNPNEDLKPNMFADVHIYAGPKDDVVMIPREALIRTENEARVILELGEGRFAPRKVVPGIESGDFVEIIAGLDEGERVVISGQFLIDSEASLKASLLRMRSMTSESAAVQLINGTGVLKALMPEQGKLNMYHDPIPAIGWPSMTMDFRLADGVSLEGLKPEDKVRFDLRQTEDGYVIQHIERRDG
ncbi:MAG: hypothetical protein AMJ69_06435 [Gammaproteobacteria bacterium SG8_47]|nr:MAG: hypothetical protein AMJ69_06435 [Gammaproteobacteria bacterium SG8_47]